jgi:hypothetical protein
MAMPDSNGMVKLEGADESKSRALFAKFQGVRIWDNAANAYSNGEVLLEDGTIIRYKDGFIHAVPDEENYPVPAVECTDSHVEFWEDGHIHRDDFPAVISEYGDWEEYWSKGKLVAIYYRVNGAIAGKG